MNKKIKVIELLLNKANNKKMPSKIRINGMDYQYKGSSYYDSYGDLLCDNLDLLCVLHDIVEILEDEEEINIQELEDVNLFDNGQNFNDIPIIIKSYDDNFTNINNTINKLIQAVKQLGKKINKED